jgi:hypothetical protein
LRLYCEQAFLTSLEKRRFTKMLALLKGMCAEHSACPPRCYTQLRGAVIFFLNFFFLPGDIVAVIGLKDTTTGDTLCDPAFPVILEKMDFPEPVIKVAVEPESKKEQDKMTEALMRLAAEVCVCVCV